MQRMFKPTGLLALAPQAFAVVVESGPPERTIRMVGDVAVVDVQGPLVHHPGSWPDSYESIVDRVTTALATDARVVAMVIDSPGGDLHGAFDAARCIRERARGAGKPLVAWISGNGCSGAYALAAAADSLQVSATACVGSIGILHTRVDATQMDQQMGLGYTLISSGGRKADGSPHTSASPQECAVAQAQVDAMAGLFFDLVSTLRAGRLTPDQLRALDAGTFIGADAVTRGLADGLASDLSAAVAAAVGGGTMPEDTEERTDDEASVSSSQTDIDDARAALERAAADGSEAATRALAALNGDDEGDDEEESDPDSAASPAAAPSAAAPAAASTASAAGATVSAAAAGGLAAQVEALTRGMAALRAEGDASRLTALLAGRQDLTKELRAHLRSMSYADARAIVDRIPKSAAPRPAAGAVVQATRGDTQLGGAVSPSSDPRLDQAFGLTAAAPTVERTEHSLTFRVPERRRTPVVNPAAPAAPAAPAGQRTGNGGSR